jgi:outer membrane translocation and assembly module TamA
MYVQVSSTATLDGDKHTTAFNLNVDEGPLYRMGRLEIQNLDSDRTDLVQKVWEIHEGDVYVSLAPSNGVHP